MGWLKCPITGIAKEIIVQLKKKSRPKRDFNYTQATIQIKKLYELEIF